METSLVNDAAQFLALVDLGPARANALQRAGFDPFAAAVAYARGLPSMMDLALLGDAVVIGRPTSVRFEDLGDGLGSTVAIAVDEVLSGTVAAGSTVTIRQRSNAAEGYTTEIQPGETERSLFVLSEGQYREFSAVAGRQPRQGANGRTAHYMPLAGRFEIDGGTIRLSVPSTIPPMALSEFRTRLQPLASLKRSAQASPAE